MARATTILMAAVLFLSAAASASAENYQSMSTDELSRLRGTMLDKPQAERDLFRAEWQKRIAQMTVDERQRYFAAGSGRGVGNRGGDELGDGSGRGRAGGQQGMGSQGNGPGNRSN